jgi:hypothetical protein
MNNKAVWILLVFLFFIAGAAGSYLFLKHFAPVSQQPVRGEAPVPSLEGQDLFVIRLFEPKDGKLEMAERRLQRRTKNLAIAEAVIEEFFKAAGNGSPVPRNVRLLGIYWDGDKVLYLDLSDELRRNFQGDALAEYLVLKGMYESLVSNVQDFQDLKILVEGKEIETLGGHFFLKYPLKNALLIEPVDDSKTKNE